MRKHSLIRAVILACLPAATALGASESTPVILQYFEAEWDTMRYRMPDVFMAGYEATWLPPPERGSAGTASIGYDLFDRFDLGTELEPTHYGTENSFRRVVDTFHRANVLVYVDWIMNHNASQDNSTPGFVDAGGYPGFVLEIPSDQWGDFHPPGTQSTNPNDPNYNLFEGRLVGLIDIDQFKDHRFIRHPVAEGDPDNIPVGPAAVRNLPDPLNARFYPDQDLPGTLIVNPGTNRNPGTTQFTILPYNVDDPMAGDATIENARELLLRSTQYYLDVLNVDGFRLDAAKHIPTSFWDTYWDMAVYQRWTGFDGVTRTPFSFVEVVENNNFIASYVRKPGENGGPGWPAQGWEFGNRDALDLNEAGALRDLVQANGFGTWGNIIGSSVDNVDGFNNGTIGVHHVNSHDNTIADGEDDTVAHAYILMRTGVPIVYHNALQFGLPPDNFPRANGRDDALGLGSDEITTLVKIRNEYARGFFIPINDTVIGGTTSQNDVLVFTRRTPSSADNLLVALNDIETAGNIQTRNVATTFPAGTRLHELTGNAADPIVDPTGQIPEILTVGADGRLTHDTAPFGVGLNVPSNRNAGNTLHGRGYVIYGPAVPSGTLSIANATTTVAPPDPAGTPDYIQRLTPVTIITSPTFDILLQTQQTDPEDPNTDDLAVFRIDSGFRDFNNNGSTWNGQPSSDFNPDNTTPDSPSYGFENFLTENAPLFDGGTGAYRQTIDAAALGDGFHYILVRAYRHRAAGLDPLFAEFRMVIYVDLTTPEVDLIDPTTNCDGDITTTTHEFVARSTDSTVQSVHFFFDQPDSTDFVSLAISGQGLMAQQGDLFKITRSFIFSGNHRVDIVAIEERPDGVVNARHETFAGIQALNALGAGPADVNFDNKINGRDVRSMIPLVTGVNPIYNPAADVDCSGVIDLDDVALFVMTLLDP